MLRSIGILALLAACGGPGFVPAPHQSLPELQTGQGRVLRSPSLVTVSYAGYEFQGEMERFGDFVASSKWLGAVGSEYGVGAATNRNVRLGDLPPSTIDQAALASAIGGWIDGGQLPPPQGDTLYVVYLPARTWFLEDGNACGLPLTSTRGIGNAAGVAYPWVAIFDCLGDADSLVFAASQAVAGAVVDPFLDSNRLPLPSPPSSPIVQDVGELCAGFAPAVEAGYKLARGWSAAAARANQNPCVPVPGNEAFTGLSGSPALVQSAAAGSTVTLDLTGWSSAETSSWVLIPSAAPTDFDPLMTIDRDRMGNGDHVTATFSVPANAVSGQVGLARLYTAPNEGFVTVGVVVR